MRWFRRRFDDGYATAQAEMRRHYQPIVEEYERLLAEAREGLAVKEKERWEAVQRGDLLMDKVLALAGVRGVSAIGQVAQAVERDAATDFLRRQEDDAFQEIAPGADCTYETSRAALIDPFACEPPDEKEIH